MPMLARFLAIRSLRRRTRRHLNRRALPPRVVELLEPRLALTVSPEEQLFVYLLNRARHDPVAYQQEANLTVDLSYVTPRPPLAVNDLLFNSAEFHATEMATNNYFSHQSQVTGEWPNKMVRDAGYQLPYTFPVTGNPNSWYPIADDSNQVESLAAGLASASGSLALLITDAGTNPPGHRIHLLGIDDFNADNREIGVGHAYNATSQYRDYYAIHATRISANDIFLTGVAFNDTNSNGRYDLNEGLAGVTIQAGTLSTTTNAAGGWSIKVPTAGSYTVTAHGGGFVGTASATFNASHNVEVDFFSGLPTGSVDFAEVPLTVGIARDGTGTMSIGSTDTIRFTLSKPSTNFAAGDVTTAGGILSNFTGSGTSYTATFTPNPNYAGTATISVAAGTFTDGTGLGNSPGSLQIPVDTVAPTVTIARDGTGILKIGSTDRITFTLSEPSTNFTGGDVTVTGGVLSNFAGSGTSYTATFTPTADFRGTASVSVAAGTFRDAAGNANAAGAPLSMPVDTVAPTVAISRNGTSTLKIGDTDTIVFRLSETSNDFAAGDVTVTGGTLSGFAGSGTLYSATFTPAANFQGTAAVAVAAAKFTNASGNPNKAAALNVPVDTVAPTVTIARSGSGTLKIGSAAIITFTLSESATTFAIGNVTFTGGTLSGFGGSGTSYSATFAPTAGFEGTATLSVAAGAFADGAGNPNPAGASLAIPVDTVPPIVTIAWSGNSPLLAGDTAMVTFTLSEPANDFTVSDAVVTNGTLTGFSGSGAFYVATFRPAWQFLGTGTVTVAAGTVTDPAGNANLAGNTVSIPIDTVAPYIRNFSASVTNATLRIGDSVTLTATFSEALLPPGGAVTVRLNSGAAVPLVLAAGGTSATGVYTVQPGDVAADLDVVAIESSTATLVSAASGRKIDPTLPSPNLADAHGIVVDGAVKLRDPGSGFSVNPGLVRDLGAVQRIPLRFTTAVSDVNTGSFRLSVNNVVMPLQGARLEGSGDAYTLILPLISRVRPYGIYRLEIAPAATIRAASNGALASNEASLWWGNRQSVGMVPDAPVGLTAMQSAPVRGKITAALTWQAPAGNGGGTVTEYFVDYRIVGTSTWLRVRTTIPASSHPGISIQGLAAGRNYEFRVAARNPSGIGPYATTQLLTTPIALAGR